MKILDRSFFQRNTVTVAQELLGKLLVREINGKKLIGIICETEAYTQTDPACHAYRGRTDRNCALFGEPGHAYIYFSYGMHFCLNAVAHQGNEAGGVLIRGILPIEGTEQMEKNRGMKNLKHLTNGPGKVAQALAINKSLYGIDLTRKGPLYLADDEKKRKIAILATPRIGISKGIEALWRFVINPEKSQL